MEKIEAFERKKNMIGIISRIEKKNKEKK